jgi:hypothetical protein
VITPDTALKNGRPERHVTSFSPHYDGRGRCIHVHPKEKKGKGAIEAKWRMLPPPWLLSLAEGSISDVSLRIEVRALVRKITCILINGFAGIKRFTL